MVLSHIIDDGSQKPVLFCSRIFSNAEFNYVHIEKEGLALVHAVRKFHQHLYGLKLISRTDHELVIAPCWL